MKFISGEATALHSEINDLHARLARWQDITPELREMARLWHQRAMSGPYFAACAHKPGGAAWPRWCELCSVLGLDPETCEAVSQEVV